MKILFSPVLLFLSSSIISQTPLQEEWLKKWDNARDYTLECIAVMPEEAMDFQPTDEVMTFAEQLVHMSKNMTWLANRFLGKEPAFDFSNVDQNSNKQELTSLVNEAYQFAREAVISLDPRELETVHDFFAGPMTGRQILNLMQDHQTHHRGQIIVYLRMKNVQPPRYRGW